MTFSVTILGSSSALPTSTRFPSAHVLQAHERLFLIDCGEGTQMQLRKLHIKFSKINNIFISHIHGDHTLGLIGLISSFNLLGRTSELNIYAHAELKKILFDSLTFYVNDLNFKVNFIPIPENKHQIIFEDKKVIVETFPLRHRVPCSGFIFREKRGLPNIRKELIVKYSIPLSGILKIKNGEPFITSDNKLIPNDELTYFTNEPRSFAYCSDTLYSEKVVRYVRDVDLLYHEATFAHSENSLAKLTGHSTTLQAAKVAYNAHVKKLIIGHFSSRYKDVSVLADEARTIFPETYAVEDGMIFDVSERKVLTTKCS